MKGPKTAPNVNKEPIQLFSSSFVTCPNGLFSLANFGNTGDVHVRLTAQPNTSTFAEDLQDDEKLIWK